MQQLAEKLIDKHLSKKIEDITKKVCLDNFESVFDKIKNLKLCDGELLHLVYERLEYFSIEKVNKELASPDFVFADLPRDNIYYDIVTDLFDSFQYYIDFRPYVSNYIYDQYYDKRIELVSRGVIDYHGNYIKY
jgi:hypothetical protein